jgi:hypothetical protein
MSLHLLCYENDSLQKPHTVAFEQNDGNCKIYVAKGHTSPGHPQAHFKPCARHVSKVKFVHTANRTRSSIAAYKIQIWVNGHETSPEVLKDLVVNLDDIRMLEGTGRYIDTDRNMFRKNLWEEVLGWHNVENFYVS